MRYARECDRVLRYLAENGGRFPLDEPELHIAECGARRPWWEGMKEFALKEPPRPR